MPARSWTDNDLTEAVAQALNLTHVLQLLNLKSNSQTSRYIRKHIERLCLSMDHFTRSNGERIIPAYSKLSNIDPETIKKIFASSISFGEVIQKTGLNACSANSYRILKRLVQQYELDTSHFVQQRRGVNPLQKDMSQVLSNNVFLNPSSLKKRLIKEGKLIYRCSICDQGPVWRDKPLILELDHIDGDPSNNQLNNLRILCLYCHSQTPTYRGRNKKH